jgi:hypothetical protein
LSHSRASLTGSESSRLLTPLVLLALAIYSIAARVPLILSHVQLEYGDGVYGASAIALRDGALPFREVFSSQGPIFLPLVRAFDELGFQALWAPRLASAVAGIVLVVATFALTRRAATIAGATAAAALVAFSPIVLDVSTQLQSDAIAVAFATIAVWLAAGIRKDEPEWWRIVMIGLASGCALGVKGPLVGPPIAVALWLILRRRGSVSALGAGVVAVCVPLLASLPWGIGNVWTQAVVMRLRAAHPDPVQNLRDLFYQYRTNDAVLLVCFVLAVALFVYRMTREQSGIGSVKAVMRLPNGDVIIAVVIWLILQGLTMLAYSPLLNQHSIYLLIPMAVLVGVGVSALERPWIWVVPLALLAAGWQVTQSDAFRSIEPNGAEVAAMEDLHSIRPLGAKVISDEPGLTWWAGRVTPGLLVDTSPVRIDTGSLTLQGVTDTAAKQDVCAILVWTGYFDQLGDLAQALPDYERVRDYGIGRYLLLRRSCSLS